MKKMSYVSVIEDVLNGVELDAERIEKLTALKASLEKRATKSEGPTKLQKQNAALAEKVAEAMAPATEYGNAEIAKLVPELEGMPPQKVAPLMKILVESGKVSGTKVKGKNVYTLA